MGIIQQRLMMPVLNSKNSLIMKKSFTLFVLLLSDLYAFSQTTYYVSTTGNDDTGDGSQGAPFASINAAFDAAIADAGDTYEVNVEAGTYTMTATIQGRFGREATITIKGDGAATTIFQRYADGEAHVNYRFFQANNANNNGVSIVLEDATFKNFGFNNTNGGGLWNGVLGDTNTATNLTVRRCIIQNASARSGAVIQTRNQNTVIFEDCYFDNITTFENNTLTAPVHFRGGTISIKNCVFNNMILDPIHSGSGVINVRRGASALRITNEINSMNAEIINNTFINCDTAHGNTPTSAWDTIRPVVMISADTGAGGAGSLVMYNNLFVGNMQEVEENGCDIWIAEDDALTADVQNNLMNKNVGITTAFDSVSESYTYDAPEINFTMDGDLPDFDTAANGLIYVTPNGTSVVGAGFADALVPANDITGATRPSPPSIGAVEGEIPTTVTNIIVDNNILHPNPAVHHVVIASGDFKSVDMYNVYGQKIKSIELNGASAFSVEEVTAGMYIIVMQKNNGSIVSTRLIKQ